MSERAIPTRRKSFEKDGYDIVDVGGGRKVRVTFSHFLDSIDPTKHLTEVVATIPEDGKTEQGDSWVSTEIHQQVHPPELDPGAQKDRARRLAQALRSILT